MTFGTTTTTATGTTTTRGGGLVLETECTTTIGFRREKIITTDLTTTTSLLSRLNEGRTILGMLNSDEGVRYLWVTCLLVLMKTSLKKLSRNSETFLNSNSGKTKGPRSPKARELYFSKNRRKPKMLSRSWTKLSSTIGWSWSKKTLLSRIQTVVSDTRFKIRNRGTSTSPGGTKWIRETSTMIEGTTIGRYGGTLETDLTTTDVTTIRLTDLIDLVRITNVIRVRTDLTASSIGD